MFEPYLNMLYKHFKRVYPEAYTTSIDSRASYTIAPQARGRSEFLEYNNHED